MPRTPATLAILLLSSAPTLHAQPLPLTQPPLTPTPKTLYIEIPITGPIGEQVFAGGVKKALAFAKNKNIRHAVFVIDSPGGLPADASAIGAVLDSFAPDFTYHAVIKNSLADANRILARCDDWFIAPAALTAPSVAHPVNSDPTAADADARLTAAAAQLAALAEAKGHPGALFRAMMITEAELWLVKDAKGQPHLSDTPADGASKQLDSPQTILACTGAQLIEWGLARPCDTSASLGEPLQLTNWTTVGNSGVSAVRTNAADVGHALQQMKTAVADIEKETKSFEAQIKAFPTIVSAARRIYPESLYLRTDYQGNLTAESRAEWMAEVDRKINRLRDVQAAAVDIQRSRGRMDVAATRHETARKNRLTLSGLTEADLPRLDLKLPEIPTDIQIEYDSAASEITAWQNRRYRTTR